MWSGESAALRGRVGVIHGLDGSEPAGACFRPSDRTLFFNLLGRARSDEGPTEGMTVAVTGPWRRGAFVIP